jgi:3-oxoacyl-[acyl-carrier protein] reductase
VSKELPPGVTINNVLPGYTATERLTQLAAANAARSGRSVEDVETEWCAQTPEQRLGRPEEIAAVIAFLVSPAASFVRGTSLAVDGGRLRSI